VSRLLIIIAALPIVITFVIRWWFGLRVLASSKRRQCRCDLDKWERAFGSENLPPSDSGDAILFATALRKAALEDWKTREPKAAISREGTRRFGLAVPPLAAMVAIMASLVGRIPFTMALAIFLLAIAFSAVISYLSITTELKAILIICRRLQDSRIFTRRDDEEAVIEATRALAWKEAAPPIFNLIQR
jgi:hypothetical protein